MKIGYNGGTQFLELAFDHSEEKRIEERLNKD
jgi:hypothetical protein